jgi:hypothetical protein
MPELEAQLRSLVDASAAPVTYEELMERRGAGGAYARRPRRGVVGLVAAALGAALVIAGVAAVLLIGRPGEDAKIGTRPARNPGSYPTECLITSANGACPRTLKQAEVMLGVPLRSPRFLPDSWVSARSVVFVTPAGYQGNTDDVASFNQVWAPLGTDLASNQATFLQIRQRATSPNEVNTCFGGRYPLQDGSTACGTMGPATYGPNQPAHDFASLDWAKDGVQYHVQAVGLAPDIVLRALNSLH